MNRTIKLLFGRVVELLRINEPYAVHGPRVIRAKASSERPREIRIRHDQFLTKR